MPVVQNGVFSRLEKRPCATPAPVTAFEADTALIKKKLIFSGVVLVLRARFRSAPALVMAPPAETTGVPSIYGDDGDSRGVWGSTRELHLRVGAHLRESRAARSDERYKTFVAYARRREEEREDAPDRGRGGEPGGTGGGEAASSANARDGARPGEEPENAGGAALRTMAIVRETKTRRTRPPDPRPGAARSARPRAWAAGTSGPRRRPWTRTRRWTRASGACPNPSPRGDGRRWPWNRARRARAPDAFLAAPAEVAEDPTLLMLKAVEKAARDLGVKRTGVWTALGKPYAVEGPPTVTPPANPRAAFPRRARHPDEVADAMARRREAARAGIPIRARGDWNDDDERDEEREFGEFGSPRALPQLPETHVAAADADSERVGNERPETPLSDVLSSSLGFGRKGGPSFLAGSRVAEQDADVSFDARAAYRERKSRGRFDRGALEASAARVRRAKFAGGGR